MVVAPQTRTRSRTSRPTLLHRTQRSLNHLNRPRDQRKICFVVRGYQDIGLNGIGGAKYSYRLTGDGDKDLGTLNRILCDGTPSS